MSSSKTGSSRDSRSEYEYRLVELQNELSQKNRTIDRLKSQIAILSSRNRKLKHDKEVYDEVIEYILKGAETIIESLEGTR